jgi:hypothetical protein
MNGSSNEEANNLIPHRAQKRSLMSVEGGENNGGGVVVNDEDDNYHRQQNRRRHRLNDRDDEIVEEEDEEAVAAAAADNLFYYNNAKQNGNSSFRQLAKRAMLANTNGSGGTESSIFEERPRIYEDEGRLSDYISNNNIGNNDNVEDEIDDDIQIISGTSELVGESTATMAADQPEEEVDVNRDQGFEI